MQKKRMDDALKEENKNAQSGKGKGKGKRDIIEQQKIGANTKMQVCVFIFSLFVNRHLFGAGQAWGAEGDARTNSKRSYVISDALSSYL